MIQTNQRKKQAKCEIVSNWYKNTFKYLLCNPNCYDFYRFNNSTCTHLFCTKLDRVTDLYSNLGFVDFKKQSTVGPCPQCGNKTVWIKDLPVEDRSTFKGRNWNLSHTSFNGNLMLIYICNKCNEKDGRSCTPFKIECLGSECVYEVDRISRTNNKINSALVLLTKLPIKVRS